MNGFRVGFGYDVHQLKEGYDFWLGGIKLVHVKGAVGHSDADVLIHVISNALLGAANMRDIGYHFSDKDPPVAENWVASNRCTVILVAVVLTTSEMTDNRYHLSVTNATGNPVASS